MDEDGTSRADELTASEERATVARVMFLDDAGVSQVDASVSDAQREFCFSRGRAELMRDSSADTFEGSQGFRVPTRTYIAVRWRACDLTLGVQSTQHRARRKATWNITRQGGRSV